MRPFAGALLLALLAACASVPLAPRSTERFDLLGRILVTYSGKAVTANLRWEHAADRGEIWLMTPTGQTLAHIVDTQHGATLTRADQQQYHAGSVEALTRQALGWSLPMAQMQYWVQGRAAPGAVARAERDSAGRLSSLSQNGWRVAFSYHADGEAQGSVRRLELSDGANEIRLVIDTWRHAT